MFTNMTENITERYYDDNCPTCKNIKNFKSAVKYATITYAAPNVTHPNWKRPIQMARPTVPMHCLPMLFKTNCEHKLFTEAICVQSQRQASVSDVPLMCSVEENPVTFSQNNVTIKGHKLSNNFDCLLRINVKPDVPLKSLTMVMSPNCSFVSTNDSNIHLPMKEGLDGWFYDFPGYGFPIVAIPYSRDIYVYVKNYEIRDSQQTMPTNECLPSAPKDINITTFSSTFINIDTNLRNVLVGMAVGGDNIQCFGELPNADNPTYFVCIGGMWKIVDKERFKQHNTTQYQNMVKAEVNNIERVEHKCFTTVKISCMTKEPLDKLLHFTQTDNCSYAQCTIKPGVEYRTQIFCTDTSNLDSKYFMEYDIPTNKLEIFTQLVKSYDNTIVVFASTPMHCITNTAKMSDDIDNIVRLLKSIQMPYTVDITTDYHKACHATCLKNCSELSYGC
jgi:hypothetical protein